jgi:hypothetical protein
MKCPERLKCGNLYCCKQEGLPIDQLVHSACIWYEKYQERMIRKQKLKKINGTNKNRKI